jgi:hypothetical protein
VGPVGQVWAAAQSHQRGLCPSAHCWHEQDVILRLFFTLLPLSPAKKMWTRCREHLYVLCHLGDFLVFLSSWFVAFLFFKTISKKNQRFFEFNHATLNMTNDVRWHHVLWLIKQIYWFNLVPIITFKLYKHIYACSASELGPGHVIIELESSKFWTSLFFFTRSSRNYIEETIFKKWAYADAWSIKT